MTHNLESLYIIPTIKKSDYEITGKNSLYTLRYGGTEGHISEDTIYSVFSGYGMENKFYELKEQRILTDIELVVSNGDITKSLYLHKIILVAYSKYFEILLNGPYKESKDHISKVQIDCKNPDVIEKVINHLYGKDIVLNNYDDLFEMLSMLQFYQFIFYQRGMDYLSQMRVKIEDLEQYLSVVKHFSGELPEPNRIQMESFTLQTDFSALSDELLIYIISRLKGTAYCQNNENFALILSLRKQKRPEELWSTVDFDKIMVPIRKQLLDEGLISQTYLEKLLGKPWDTLETFKYKLALYFREESAHYPFSALIHDIAPNGNLIILVGMKKKFDGLHPQIKGDAIHIEAEIAPNERITPGSIIRVFDYSTIKHYERYRSVPKIRIGTFESVSTVGKININVPSSENGFDIS